MSTSLAVYQKVDNLQSFVKELGRAIAKSQMFGCSSIDQGEVFALECAARGVPPLMLAERYHVILGKLSMKSDAMLAEFNRAGGRHRIIDRTPDLAAIELTDVHGQKAAFSLSWQEAQGEPFVYDGKESDVLKLLASDDPKVRAKLTLKAKYQTPNSRKQMLWARVVSDAVRAMWPGVNSGQYTPEEIDDFTPTNGQASGQHTDNVVDVEPEPVTTAPVATNGTAATVTPTTTPACETEPAQQDGFANKQQVARLRELFTQAGVTPDQQAVILEKRHAQTLRNLTVADAAELIQKLEAKLSAVQATNVAGESRQGDVRTQAVSNDGATDPCTAAQVETIKQLLMEHAQLDPMIWQKIKDKITAVGLNKIADLSRRDAALLEQSVRMKHLADFFAASLSKPVIPVAGPVVPKDGEEATEGQPAGELVGAGAGATPGN